MEIRHFKNDKASYLTFENIYDDRELELIWQEASFLCHERKLMNPDESGSARDIDGVALKRNNCIWITSAYKNENVSNYLSLYRKGLNQLSADKVNLIKIDFNMKLFFGTNYDETLLSYYENEDYYKPHYDRASYTYVFWLFKEPKRFIGGNLKFTELNRTVNIKNNMAVLFPSWLDHEVDKIQMCDTIEKYNCNGRFAFSTFFHVQG